MRIGPQVHASHPKQIRNQGKKYTGDHHCSEFESHANAKSIGRRDRGHIMLFLSGDEVARLRVLLRQNQGGP